MLSISTKNALNTEPNCLAKQFSVISQNKKKVFSGKHISDVNYLQLHEFPPDDSLAMRHRSKAKLFVF